MAEQTGNISDSRNSGTGSEKDGNSAVNNAGSENGNGNSNPSAGSGRNSVFGKYAGSESASRIGNPLLVGAPDPVKVVFNDDSDDEIPEPTLPRRRGRPPGSKNKTSAEKTTVNRQAKLANLFKYTQIFDDWGFDDDECDFNAKVLCSPDAPEPVKKLINMVTGGSGNNDFGFGVGVGLAVGMYAFKRAGKINDVGSGLRKRSKQNNPIRFNRTSESPIATGGNDDSNGNRNPREESTVDTASYAKSPKDKVAGIFGLT